MRLTIVQMDTGSDYDENIKKIDKFVKIAAESGSDFVVFPETMEYIGPDIYKNAIEITGSFTEKISSLASRYNIYIYCGSVTEKRICGKTHLYNTSIIFNRNGKLFAEYSKMHMFDVKVKGGPSFRESDVITPGSEIVLADTEYGRIGMSICYDIRFPEQFRIMEEMGAEIIFVPANFNDVTGKMHWKTLIQARAIENECFIAACDETGEKYNGMSHGNSMIIDPYGRIISCLDKEEGIITSDIDLDMVKKARSEIPSVDNRRNDIYSLSSDKIKIYKDPDMTL